jgi:hypothetical protein
VIPRDEYGSFPEDVAPTGPVTITIPQHDRAATAPFTDEPLTVEHGDFGTRITLNRLEVHQVIVVTPG